MMVTIYILASLGAFVVLAVAVIITREIYRAIRQSYRVAYVYERIRGYRSVTAKMWWTAFKYE